MTIGGNNDFAAGTSCTIIAADAARTAVNGTETTLTAGSAGCTVRATIGADVLQNGLALSRASDGHTTAHSSRAAIASSTSSRAIFGHSNQYVAAVAAATSGDTAGTGVDTGSIQVTGNRRYRDGTAGASTRSGTAFAACALIAVAAASPTGRGYTTTARINVANNNIANRADHDCAAFCTRGPDSTVATCASDAGRSRCSAAATDTGCDSGIRIDI